MVSIGTITNDAYLGVGIFMTILLAGMIVARIRMSIRQFKRLLADDWLSIAGFAIVVAFFVFNEYQYKGFFKPADLGYNINAGLAVPIMAAASLWFSKAPILILYRRLFGIQTWMRWTCLIVLVLSAIGFIGSLIPPLMQCRPRDTPYVLPKWQRCGKANVDAGVVAGSVSAAADLVIFVLPLRPIFSLNLSRRKKVGLGFVFGSGLFGVLASLLSLIYKVHLFQGARSDLGSILTTMLLQFVECAIALMVGCVPAIRGFWKGYIQPSKFYTSIGSLRTRLMSSHGSRKFSQTPKTEGRGDDFEMDNRFGPMGTMNFRGSSDAYILMESAHGSKTEVHRAKA